MIALILKIALGLVVLLVAGIAVAWTVGCLLSREHVVSRAIVFSRATPTEVWHALTDYAAQPEWRSDLRANIRESDKNGHQVWRNEMKRDGSMALEMMEVDPPHRLVSQIVDAGGPFGGKWTYTIEPRGAGSRLTIEEEGWVKAAIFRAIGRYVIGYGTTIEKFMKDLAKHLNEHAAPEA
jgi:uncharacterized protein YndB with AHSA1/START domain